ncbi:hypothetical protein PCASD_04772 [Puccinia coronata f. sp. avenae]|uniref:Uncharacterized protein n=1 Tax=Puccinia coronata f. sp. avenae TaxID=200324 RepID=A0A2N5V705_9BASI|nr:hypothetical protein PCASD_04772 [Puccinia coronata f. sp. avenae]
MIWKSAKQELRVEVENRRRRPTLALDFRAVLSSVHSSPMPSIALIGALVLALKQTGTTALFSVPTSPMPVPTCSLMAMNEPQGTAPSSGIKSATRWLHGQLIIIPHQLISCYDGQPSTPPSSILPVSKSHCIPFQVAANPFLVFIVTMLAFKIIFALSIAVPPLLAGAFVAAHPLNITTATTASTSYQSLTTRIQTLRYNIAKGQYTYSEARSQIQSFSYEASTTLTAINGCPTCFRSGSVYTLTQSAQRTYTELDSLVDTCYRVYPRQAPSLFTSWTHLDAHFHRNLRLFFDSGVKATSILPSTFVYTTSRASWSQTSDFTSRYFSVATGF